MQSTRADELLERFAGPGRRLLDNPEIAGFCYTQLTDTEQERNGLLDEHRKPKVDPTAIWAANRRPSAAVPADAIAEIQVGARRPPPAGGSRGRPLFSELLTG